ncbi:hypothetical protein G4B88_020455 [Cannabis sativa]|uniref:Uncharacterized protein n=1 Tax=Cannabis sativa TaxID=3483 RepID=A0A7J6DVU4_CANSA|nr:hypothetical protein G4B88_020455 [Cannabis sativa]
MKQAVLVVLDCNFVCYNSIRGWFTLFRRSSIILGSIMPDSFSDALDPAHHGVLHSAAPTELKGAGKVEACNLNCFDPNMICISGEARAIEFLGRKLEGKFEGKLLNQLPIVLCRSQD